MILLSGHSLTPARKVPMEALSLTLKERDSTASMTPADMTGITMNSWLKDDTNPGKNIVWRVKGIRTAYATDTATVELEHAIGTLRDTLLNGDITPATITGNAKATTCTAEQAVRFILSKQGDWVLGSFDYGPVSGAYKFNGDSLFDALESVSATLDECWWSYDFSVYPFRLHMNMMNASTGESELRAGRNIRTITKSVDRNGMYTRIYPIGKNDLRLSGTGYVQKNQNAYGVIEHTETDSSIDSEAELRQWATIRLGRHCEPQVSIEVDALELAEATGVAMDRLTLGRVCRVPLPEFGTTITERIVGLNYQDKLFQPEVVRVTLANNREDVTKVIADELKRGGGGRAGRSAGKEEKERMAWFEDTNDHVAMVAKGIVGTDAQGNPNWTRLSKIVVDGNGIHQTVESVQNDVQKAKTAIEQNEYQISLRATKKDVSAQIKVTADRIEQRVDDTERDLSSSIRQEADRISLVVEGTGPNAKIKPASIVASINGASSQIKISADHIVLDGDAIASSLEAKDVMFGTMNAANGEVTEDFSVLGDLRVAADVSCSDVSCNTVTVDGEGASWQTYTARRVTLSDSHAYRYESPTGASYGTVNGRIVTGYSDTILHYLGYPHEN